MVFQSITGGIVSPDRLGPTADEATGPVNPEKINVSLCQGDEALNQDGVMTVVKGNIQQDIKAQFGDVEAKPLPQLKFVPGARAVRTARGRGKIVTPEKSLKIDKMVTIYKNRNRIRFKKQLWKRLLWRVKVKRWRKLTRRWEKPSPGKRNPDVLKGVCNVLVFGRRERRLRKKVFRRPFSSEKIKRFQLELKSKRDEQELRRRVSLEAAVIAVRRRIRLNKLWEKESSFEHQIQRFKLRALAMEAAVLVKAQERQSHLNELKLFVQAYQSRASYQELLQNPLYVGNTTANNQKVAKYLLDSGASVNSHDDQRTNSSNIRAVQGMRLSGFTGQSTDVKHDADVQPPAASEDVKITLRSYAVPNSRKNLLSVGVLDRMGYTTTFSDGKGLVRDKKGRLIFYAELKDHLYELQHMDQKAYSQQLRATKSKFKSDKAARDASQHARFVSYDSQTLLRYHELLGHRGFAYVRKIMGFPPKSKDFLDPVCQACHQAQFRSKDKPKDALTAAPRRGFRLHSDTSDILPTASYGAEKDIQRYVLTADELSGKLFVNFVQRKSQVKHKVLSTTRCIKSEISPDTIAEHQTDGGTEFANGDLDRGLEEQGIKPRNSDPHCQYENGLIESHMDFIQNKALAMLYRANAPLVEWPYAVAHAVFLWNNSPKEYSKFTPEEQWSGIQDQRNKAENSKAALFCAVEAKVYKHGKYESESRSGIYLGRSDRSPGHLIRVIGGKKRSRKVKRADVISADLNNYPYTNPRVPRPEEKRRHKYDSDTEDEEKEIVDLPSDATDSEDESDCPSLNDGTDSEEEDQGSDEEEKKQPVQPRYVPVPEDGQIGNQPGYEIVKILDIRKFKKNNRTVTTYKVKWKDEKSKPTWKKKCGCS